MSKTSANHIIMEFEVLLFSSATNYSRFSLRVVQSHPRIRLEYVLPNKQVFMTDFLDIFHTVKMDETDGQLLSLIGPITRKIKFVTSSGFSNFCTYLKQVFDMKASPDNFQLLTLRPRNPIPQSPVPIPKQRRVNFDAVKLTSFPTEGECEFADDFTNDFIWQKPVKITPSECEILQPGDVLKSVVPFSALDPEPKAIISLWEKALNNGKTKQEILDSYLKVKNQWSQRISLFHFRKNSSLRAFIQKLEYFIDQKTEFKTRIMKSIVFDISLTLFYFTYSKCVMTESLFKLIDLFVSLYIVGSNNNTSEEDKEKNVKVCMLNGETVSYNEACAYVFAIFSSFYSKYLSNYEENDILPRPQDIILSCETFARKFLPSSAYIYDLYLPETLQHCASIFYSFMINYRSKEECKLLISSFLTNSKPSIFMRCIICAAIKQFTSYVQRNNIVLNRNSQNPGQSQESGNEGQEMSQEGPNTGTNSGNQQQNSQQTNQINILPFEPVFDSFLKQVNFRLLLHNEELLQSFTAPYIKTKN